MLQASVFQWRLKNCRVCLLAHESVKAHESFIKNKQKRKQK
jgi:hypothetical protein